MEEKKKKSPISYLIILLIFAIVCMVGGIALTMYVELDVMAFDIDTIVEALNSENFWTYTGGCALVLGLIVIVALTKNTNNTPKVMTDKNYDVDSDKKGSARWLTDKEINNYFPRCAYDEVGKYKINGFVIQTIETSSKTFANYKDGVHCLIIGTTGSGKTIRFVTPTMQFLARSGLRPSLVVTDPKGELYANQSKLYQERGYEVLTLNLREPLKRSSCWNPCRIAYDEYQEGLKQKELIKFHGDNVDNYKGKLKLAENKSEFHEQWYEFNGYAFANLKSAMVEAERRSGSLKAKAQESISDLVQTIYAESARKAQDPFWTKSASSLVEGLLLAMLEDSEIPSLGITAERFNLGTVSSTLALRVDKLKSYFAIRDVSSNAKRKAQGPLGAPTGGTQESIISTAMADLASFADPDIQYITCNNDINFKDLGRKPTVVFLIIPDEKENKHIFASLFITQAYKSLVELACSEEGVNGACPHPVNFIIDEFANMPVIPGMENKITVARSRGISFMIIIQALSQLRAKYGPDVAEIIRSNCNLQVFLATNDNETAEYFSKICGEKTIKDMNVSVDQTGKQTESYSLSSRALITPSELLTLPEGVSIAKLLRTQPARVKQSAYWKSKSYYKGEQVVETKWNPNLFIFDKDGFYDIVDRNRNEVEYVLNDINKYDVKVSLNDEDDSDDNKDNGSKTEHIDKSEDRKNELDSFFSELEKEREAEPITVNEVKREVSSDSVEKENSGGGEFNFDDIVFNFDDIINDPKKEDLVADPVSITDTAYIEASKEAGISIDEEELSKAFRDLNSEFVNQ